MSAEAERSLPVPTRVRSNSSSASVVAMAGRIVRDAAAAVHNSNGRRNSSVLRSSSPRLRKPRASGRESVAVAGAAEIAAKNPLRMRTRPLRNSSSNRVRRASRVRRDRRRPHVRMPRERQRLVRKVMDRNGAAVFGVAGVVAAADRKALRRLRSHAETRGRGEKPAYASSVMISISVVPPI